MSGPKRPCPTPQKTCHKSTAEAWGHAHQLRRERHASVDVKPYLCKCGAWHVGHSQASLRRRIRLALRGAKA